MKQVDDYLWNSLYWTRDVTRSDRLAKAMNTIIRKNSTDASYFLYDSQAVKNIQKFGLTQSDIDRIEQLDRLLLTHALKKLSASHGEQSDNAGNLNIFEIVDTIDVVSNVNQLESKEFRKEQTPNQLNTLNIQPNSTTQYTFTLVDVNKYLSKVSDHIYLEDDIILPKPIEVHLIKISTLRSEANLLSHTALVRTQKYVHILPLRCPLKENDKTKMMNQNDYNENKIEQLVARVDGLTNHSIKCHQEYEKLEDQIHQLVKTVEGLTNQLNKDKFQQSITTVETLINQSPAHTPEYMKSENRVTTFIKNITKKNNKGKQ